MESFAIIVNGFWTFTIVARLSILDVYGGLGYTSGKLEKLSIVEKWNFQNI